MLCSLILCCRFDKLLDRTVKRGELLDEVHSALTVFSNATVQFELWYCELLDAVESRDILKLEIPEYAVKIGEIVAKRDAKQGEFDGIVRNGKNLVTKKDVTDTVPVRDKIKVCLYRIFSKESFLCLIQTVVFLFLVFPLSVLLFCFIMLRLLLQ